VTTNKLRQIICISIANECDFSAVWSNEISHLLTLHSRLVLSSIECADINPPEHIRTRTQPRRPQGSPKLIWVLVDLCRRWL